MEKRKITALLISEFNLDNNTCILYDGMERTEIALCEGIHDYGHLQDAK